MPESLVERLKRRKLVQWAVAYLAGAWLVLQVLGLLAQPFAWPDLVLRAATVLLAIGFFAALVLAWYHGEKGAQRASGVEILMLAGILVIAGAAVAFVGRSYGRRAGPPPAARPPAGATAASASDRRSIAVLPFANLSSDPQQEYFSDGLTDELLDALTHVPGLRVASRTSAFAFRGKEVSVDSIARALRVAHVLEGSVRKAGNRVRITAQLIRADSGYHLWSETYDRELKDVFSVQDTISRAIVAALELQLSGAKAGSPLVKEETRDPVAHDLALQGDYLARKGTREGLAQGLELFQQAIARDPGYARAYAGLAASQGQRAYQRYGPRDELRRQAREAARRSIALDSTLAEGYFVLGDLAWQADFDLAAAERQYGRAIELNPGLAGAHSRHAWILMDLGKKDEALAEAKRAVELDPVSAGMLSNLGSMYSYAGQNELALQTYQAAVKLQPESQVTLGNLAMQLSQMKRHDEAIRMAERARAADASDQFTLAVLAFVYGRAGRRADAQQALQALRAQPEPGPYFLATAYAGLGDREQVFAQLTRAATERDESVTDLAVDPVFDPYRGDPRMRALIQRIGLP